MNNAGDNKKTAYLVIALLIVGLTAYSNAVKELTEIHHVTLGASQLIAQLSNETVPAQVPPIPQTIVKLESCKRPEIPAIAEPSVTAPVELQEKVDKSKPRARVKPSTNQIAKIKKVIPFNFDEADFEVRVQTDQFPEPDAPMAVELPVISFKAKARKHNILKMNPRDREMLLKSLNRSINLRIAG